MSELDEKFREFEELVQFGYSVRAARILAEDIQHLLHKNQGVLKKAGKYDVFVQQLITFCLIAGITLSVITSAPPSSTERAQTAYQPSTERVQSVSRPNTERTVTAQALRVTDLFKLANSLGSRAIGHAEGNLTVSGEKTSRYDGHTDPGNLSWGEKVTNRGFCSDQGRGATVEAADIGCLKRLNQRVPTLIADLKAAGIANPTVEEFINIADLYNQASPDASRDFPRHLAEYKAKGVKGLDLIADARTASFYVNGKNMATGLTGICRRENWGVSDWECVRLDQMRRVKAIASVLKYSQVPASSMLSLSADRAPSVFTPNTARTPTAHQPHTNRTASQPVKSFGNLLLNFFNSKKAKAASGVSAQSIINYMESKGYKVFRNPGEVNIIHIRNGSTARDLFEDRRIVIRFSDSVPVIVGDWAETTKPGLAIVRNPTNPKGAFAIAPGQYTAWQIDTHVGSSGRYAHEALIQSGGFVSGFRDTNGDGFFDTPDQGNFWINIHAPWSNGTRVIDRSAGCLVVSKKEDHESFMNIVKKDPRYIDNPKFIFTATIVDGAKL